MERNVGIIKMTHDYGMRKIKSLPGVISATHVERKKYMLDTEGKLFSVPEYIIKVRLRKMDSSVVDREVKLTTHPDAIGINEYNYIINNVFKDGR